MSTIVNQIAAAPLGMTEFAAKAAPAHGGGPLFPEAMLTQAQHSRLCACCNKSVKRADTLRAHMKEKHELPERIRSLELLVESKQSAVADVLRTSTARLRSCPRHTNRAQFVGASPKFLSATSPSPWRHPAKSGWRTRPPGGADHHGQQPRPSQHARVRGRGYCQFYSDQD